MSLPSRWRPIPGSQFLNFIGSSQVGRHLRSKLPPGTRCALEHGGAAPVIIDRDADLDTVGHGEVEIAINGPIHRRGVLVLTLAIVLL
jgi:acyl-CoA reductase-like NAD-dependent aldehyde dehydrogenase